MGETSLTPRTTANLAYAAGYHTRYKNLMRDEPPKSCEANPGATRQGNRTLRC